MWKSDEFVDVPQEISSETSGVQIEKKTIKVKGSELFYQECVPSDNKKSLEVLLLHGASFTSQTWVDIGTFQLVAAMGHRVVALDIPGYGNSPGSSNFKLGEFCAAVNLEKPVIVSPSMSGGHSIPYIFTDPETWSHRASGFIPVAPVATNSIHANDYAKCAIPTMHVVGRRDTVQGKIGCRAMKDLSALCNVETVILEDAGHACYMNQIDKWNRLVYNFLRILENGSN